MSVLATVRSLLMAPLAPGPYVRVEGASVEGDGDSPVVRLYLWVETPATTSVLTGLRLETTWPAKESPPLDVRERWHEDRVLSFPMDTGGISPRLTVLARLSRPLPAVRGIVEGRVAATAGPGPLVRWSPFRAIYRWDVQPVAEPIEAGAPEPVEGPPGEPRPEAADA